MMGYRLRDVLKVRAAEGAEFRLTVPQLDIEKGDKIALVGPSGCGKSTLLDMLALVLSPSKATIFDLHTEDAKPQDIALYWRKRRRDVLSTIRKHHIGYVLQTGGLLPFISVRDNIRLSLRLAPRAGWDTMKFVVGELGIARHLDKLPGALSVGERQRVAIARALVHRPSIVIADEPTASLDPCNASRIMKLFVRLTGELNLTLVIASHDADVVRELGLRELEHSFHATDDENVVVSEFKG
ncbi:MAG: ATP-binding cassette domain-containing protein [Pseudomonadota bacterium]|nr:ATP-binding cassette domain-containing protein [Pseudomonadota bacterium]